VTRCEEDATSRTATASAESRPPSAAANDHTSSSIRDLAGSRIEKVEGVLNGTTNYILTSMAEAGMSYADALAEAQRRGIAETDPMLDVEGYELEVLRGLDLSRHAPSWILIEMHDLEQGRVAIGELLGERYLEYEQLSPMDVLYRRSDDAVRSSAGRAWGCGGLCGHVPGRRAAAAVMARAAKGGPSGRRSSAVCGCDPRRARPAWWRRRSVVGAPSWSSIT